MRKPKIYIETTLFNRYFEKDRDAHADTVALFKHIAAGKCEPYTSEAVIEELEKARDEKRAAMLALLNEYKILVLPATPEARLLAEIYISEGIIPPTHRMDALHVAITSINELDIIASLNFQHIVREKTVRMTRVVNTAKGYRPIQILTPKETLEHEKN